MPPSPLRPTRKPDPIERAIRPLNQTAGRHVQVGEQGKAVQNLVTAAVGSDLVNRAGVAGSTAVGRSVEKPVAFLDERPFRNPAVPGAGELMEHLEGLRARRYAGEQEHRATELSN